MPPQKVVVSIDLNDQEKVSAKTLKWVNQLSGEFVAQEKSLNGRPCYLREDEARLYWDSGQSKSASLCAPALFSKTNKKGWWIHDKAFKVYVFHSGSDKDAPAAGWTCPGSMYTYVSIDLKVSVKGGGATPMNPCLMGVCGFFGSMRDRCSGGTAAPAAKTPGTAAASSLPAAAASKPAAATPTPAVAPAAKPRSEAASAPRTSAQDFPTRISPQGLSYVADKAAEHWPTVRGKASDGMQQGAVGCHDFVRDEKNQEWVASSGKACCAGCFGALASIVSDFCQPENRAWMMSNGTVCCVSCLEGGKVRLPQAQVCCTSCFGVLANALANVAANLSQRKNNAQAFRQPIGQLVSPTREREAGPQSAKAAADEDAAVRGALRGDGTAEEKAEILRAGSMQRTLRRAQSAVEVLHRQVTTTWREPLSLFDASAAAKAADRGVPQWAVQAVQLAVRSVDDAVSVDDLRHRYEMQIDSAVRDGRKLERTPLVKLLERCDRLAEVFRELVPLLAKARQAFDKPPDAPNCPVNEHGCELVPMLEALLDSSRESTRDFILEPENQPWLQRLSRSAPATALKRDAF